MRHLAGLLLLGALATAAAAAPRPKNVIVLVGDGVGVAHVTAARWARGDEFQIGRMPVVALVTTHAADAAVTDSAAAASAFATGVKTRYRAISVDAAGIPRKTVLEAAVQRGRAAGVVTTARFWDATVAAFAAHAKDRYLDAPAILRQVLASGAELIVGAGLELLGKDGLPNVEELRQGGLSVAVEPAALLGSDAPRVLGVFPSQKYDMENPEAPLAVLTGWAIERLGRDPDGFFLVVEQEGTDGASHNNAAAELRSALVSFDAAVGVALDFASKRDDTLVIVTGDHETGGMRVTEGRDLRRWRTEWSTTEHTGEAVALFAFGPGAGEFGGIVDNSEVGRKLLAIQVP